MKIRSLRAERVHGYLPLQVDFFDDLTFLTGLNGSGKTSALRLLMALLTPNLEELGAISYASATVIVEEDSLPKTVRATKTPEGIELVVSSVNGTLLITSAELELLQEAKRREEPRSPLTEKYTSHPIIQAIRGIATPMFLGLDRRFSLPVIAHDDISELRRREYLARRYWPDDPSAMRNTSHAAVLIDVNYLVVTKMQEIRAEQEQLDERLRAQFFAKAFEYKPNAIQESRLPSTSQLNRYRQQLAKIEQAAEGIKIPVPEIQAALTKFFERMSKLVETLNRTNQNAKTKRKAKRPTDKTATELITDHDYLEWIVNWPQADRIVEHLRLLEEYIEKRDALRHPIARFLSLVNSFFQQTQKTVAVAPSGQLTVAIEGSQQLRSIAALSSGERQLLVMLAHLALNPSLTGSGVFIVDEPELSLHIDWQEKFVDAIREANPNVQLILATHSPAVILDRQESCRSLS